MTWKQFLWPLRSRKAQVALVTVIASLVARLGFEVDNELLGIIVGLGVSLILGIAYEDAGKPKPPPEPGG